jgi:DNA-binding response OmpR family regulator
MKKILLAKNIHAALQKDCALLNRSDITVFVAETNDEALTIHRTERVHLMITELEMPGMASEQFCSLIREDETLRTVSILMVCANTPAAIERSRQCRANAVLLQPVHPLVLEIKAQQLLDVAAREAVHVLLSANVDGRTEGDVFYCRSRNISATGMLIETDQPLPEGARLSCLFYLPDAKKIRATCKVIRTIDPSPGDEERQYGLMFTDIAPETKKLLSAFIEKTSRRPAQDMS